MKLLLSVALCAALMAVAIIANPAHPSTGAAPPVGPPSHELHFGVDDCDLENDTHFEGLKNRWQDHHGINCSDYPNGCEILRNCSRFVKQNRAGYKAGNETALCGLTKFSHLSPEDFAATYLGGKVSSKPSRTRRALVGRRPGSRPYNPWNPWGQPATTTLSPPANNPGPSSSGVLKANGSLNWANLGAVTPVKDQGVCGDCWAFAATGCMEGAYYLAKGVLQDFSEQQLVECVSAQSRGCNGGTETDAYAYAQTFGGMDTEASYPYTSGTNARYSKCSSTASSRKKIPFSLTYNAVNSGDAYLLAAVKKQPVDCGIGVSNGMTFQNYVGGVISSQSYCLPARQINLGMLNHAVLVVGYNGTSSSSSGYWIAKNSWGTGWGINGYFYLSWATPNMCGISSDAYTVTVS